jgi:predicted transcriptional regulator
MATETKSRSVRIPATYVERLDALAQQRGCTRADVLSEALDAYLDVEERQIKAIQKTINALDAGEPLIEHARVMEWVRSWGTPNELPRPR